MRTRRSRRTRCCASIPALSFLPPDHAVNHLNLGRDADEADAVFVAGDPCPSFRGELGLGRRL
ncbi:exported hypothetical protein [Burkholderiales bacterium]|nr:exported hypothetical protein [Burkholderiales bacterium]